MGFSDCRCNFLPYRNLSWNLLVVLRNENHLKFIRSLPCCSCNAISNIQAAHIRKGVPKEDKGGMGLKPSDKWTVPLCAECHNLQHTVGEISFWGNIDLALRLAEFLFISDRRDAIHRIMGFRREIYSARRENKTELHKRD